MRSDPLPAHSDLEVVSVTPAAEADGDRAGRPRDPQLVSASPQRKPSRSGFVSELPLALVICGLGLGLVVIALHHFRWGNLAISMSVLAGGLFRLVLPARKAGLLVVRSRFTDVVTMGIIGGALMVLAAVTST